LKLVKIAVGLKPHELVKVIQDQAKSIDELKSKVADLEVLKAEVSALRESVNRTASKNNKRGGQVAAKRK